jgi:hypothetical protein
MPLKEECMLVPARKRLLGLTLTASVISVAILAVGGGFGAALSDPCTDAGGTPGIGNPGELTCTFSTPNSVGSPSYAFMLPAGATAVSAQARGGQGGLSGGKGADATASFSGLGGTTLTIVVGAKGQDLCMASPPMFLPCGGGFPDGGAGGFGSGSYLGSGGGSTRVSSPTELLLVAGAGGGAGVGSPAGGGIGGDASTDGGKGADASGATGGSGGKGASEATPGGGGVAGTGSCANGVPGTTGTAAGQGGNGGWNGGSATTSPAGGGGGGYAGGGGGGGGGNNVGSIFPCGLPAFGGGGGGGSSFAAPSATNVSINSSAVTGDGQVVIIYTGPSVVTLASASAATTTQGVVVRWRTGTEADLLGFHVYRSRGHAWRRISHSLIGAKGSVSGASYRFLDRTARRGISYRYRIKALRQDGTARWFGPVPVT